MRVLVIDNYDSFTYNLVHYIGELGADTEVVRNDRITLDEIAAKAPDAIVISPGPATPDQAGICLSLVERFSGEIPLFGVCLGLQAMGQAFGGKVVRAASPMHGKVSVITHDGRGVFKGINGQFEATRYHSLVLDEKALPGVLAVTARSEDGQIMGIEHSKLPVHGVQFHPESIASENGHAILQNFLNIAKDFNRDKAA
ncbi:anthranilate synthase component II [Pelagibacterium sediminicola]|uniref:anthranilate synthase component II n=1 Tax=Pelagibacterium sediminicola TaxID=2248761 RepID=UPI000E324882|nr:aminodeoxychorismate/anthranilate synthase component II [Pelagibacterium sediminicola]